MFTQFSDITILLFIILAAIIPVTIVLLFTVLSLNKKMKRIENYLELIQYNHLAFRARFIETDELIEKILNDQKTNEKELKEKFDHLSSSTTALLRIIKEDKQKTHMPKPNEVKEIEQTIQDQISMEVMKSLDLNAPNEDYIIKITNNVCRTYPDIDIEYIGNKVVATIEAFVKRKQE